MRSLGFASAISIFAVVAPLLFSAPPKPASTTGFQNKP